MCQTVQNITQSQLEVLIAAVFAKGEPRVSEAYSEFGEPITTFASVSELSDHIDGHLSSEKGLAYLVVHYSDMSGYVREKRIDLTPGAVEGHSHRFCMEGWGLIQLQARRFDSQLIECRIAVNSEARAFKWQDTYDEFRSPDLWDWSAVKRHAERLVRLLRKLGKEQRASSSPIEP